MPPAELIARFSKRDHFDWRDRIASALDQVTLGIRGAFISGRLQAARTG
jgi:hypothetical protein